VAGLNDPNVQNPLATVAQVTNFQVTAKMLEVVEGMRPGMSATVDIITSQSPNALSIPIQSLTSSRSNKKGTNIVFVYDNNIVKERVVETGIVGDRDYEVLSGLEEGEQIVTGSFIAISRELTDGMKVKIRELQKNRKKRG
jgi:HlyD family secretion protein